MDLLGVWERCLDLVQFDLIVECHHGDTMLCGILDVGLLLAWVRIDDAIRADLHVKDTLDLALQTHHHLILAQFLLFMGFQKL